MEFNLAGMDAPILVALAGVILSVLFVFFGLKTNPARSGKHLRRRLNRVRGGMVSVEGQAQAVSVKRSTTDSSLPSLDRAVKALMPHPEVLRDGPDSCPICGMALEPLEPTFDEAESPELVDMTRRFWISLALTLPVFGLAMGEMIPGNPVGDLASSRTLAWVQGLLATPVVLWGGASFFARGWASVLSRHVQRDAC